MTLRLIAVFTIVVLECTATAAPSAEELFDQGQASFAESDYASAVAKWNESYELSKEPELLFDIAQALRLDGRCAEALATYRRFITKAPTSQRRSLADDFVRELTATCDGAETTLHAHRQVDPVERSRRDDAPDEDSRTTDDRRSAARPGRTKKLAGIVVGGAGLATIAVGVGLGARASALGDEVTLDCSRSCNWPSEQNRDAAGRRDATIGYALDALGALAVAGGVVSYYLGSHESEIRVAPIGTRSHDSGAVLSWRRSW